MSNLFVAKAWVIGESCTASGTATLGTSSTHMLFCDCEQKHGLNKVTIPICYVSSTNSIAMH
jgi:hypothetical protein